jgi:hypothetical protein
MIFGSMVTGGKMDIMQLPLIARSDYREPMFQLVTIRQENGVYKLVSREGLGARGIEASPELLSWGADGKWIKIGNPDYKDSVKGYSNTGFAGLQKEVEQDCWGLQSRTLFSIHRAYLINRERYVAFRLKYNIPENPNLAFFRSVADENCTFWIDRYIAGKPDFKSDVQDICSAVLGLNVNYAEDLYTVAAYLLFGELIVDVESELCAYMYGKVINLMKLLRRNANATASPGFDSVLLAAVKSGIAREEDGFLERLEHLRDNCTWTCGPLAISIFSKLFIIEVVDPEGAVVMQFLEVGQALSRNIFFKMIHLVNKKTGDPDPLSVAQAATGSFHELFLSADLELAALMGTKLFCQIPVKRIKAIEFRGYFPKINGLREARLGSRVFLRPNAYDARQLHYLIEMNGLFGFPRSKAPKILDREDWGCGRFLGQIRLSNRVFAYTPTDSSHPTKA